MEKTSDPPQVTSPNVEESQTTTQATTSGSMPSDPSLLKNEPQSRIDQMKSEAPTPKLEPSTVDVKEEMEEPDTTEQVTDALTEEVQDEADAQPIDSEAHCRRTQATCRNAGECNRQSKSEF